MTNMMKRSALVLTAASMALALALFVAPRPSQADDETPSITIGTFQPSDVASQTGLSQQIQEKMAGLQQRMQTAQQSQDQAAMQAIQGEAQKIQQDMVEKFQASVDEALPGIAKEASVDIIALEVAYAADGIETKDVTTELVTALGGTPAAETPAPSLGLPQGSQ